MPQVCAFVHEGEEVCYLRHSLRAYVAMVIRGDYGYYYPVIVFEAKTMSKQKIELLRVPVNHPWKNFQDREQAWLAEHGADALRAMQRLQGGIGRIKKRGLRHRLARKVFGDDNLDLSLLKEEKHARRITKALEKTVALGWEIYHKLVDYLKLLGVAGRLDMVAELRGCIPTAESIGAAVSRLKRIRDQAQQAEMQKRAELWADQREEARLKAALQAA